MTKTCLCNHSLSASPTRSLALKSQTLIMHVLWAWMYYEQNRHGITQMELMEMYGSPYGLLDRMEREFPPRGRHINYLRPPHKLSGGRHINKWMPPHIEWSENIIMITDNLCGGRQIIYIEATIYWPLDKIFSLHSKYPVAWMSFRRNVCKSWQGVHYDKGRSLLAGTGYSPMVTPPAIL